MAATHGWQLIQQILLQRCVRTSLAFVARYAVAMWVDVRHTSLRCEPDQSGPAPHIAHHRRRRYRTFKDEHRLYMLMDYVAGGELFRHLRAAGCGATTMRVHLGSIADPTLGLGGGMPPLIDY